MNNKRTLVISTIAILAVILSVTTILAYTSSAKNTKSIPVTGRSSSGDQQNQAANSSVINKFESAEQMQDLHNQQAQAANSNGISDADPGWDHISGQQAQPIDTAVPVDLDPSWDHISGQ